MRTHKPLRTRLTNTTNNNVYYSEWSIKGVERAIGKGELIPIYADKDHGSFGYLNPQTPFYFESLDASSLSDSD